MDDARWDRFVARRSRYADNLQTIDNKELILNKARVAVATHLRRPGTGLAALGALGRGFPYLVLDHVLGYQGDPMSAAYEYGTAFLITASLMNLLLVLDAWDIARGLKD